VSVGRGRPLWRELPLRSGRSQRRTRERGRRHVTQVVLARAAAVLVVAVTLACGGDLRPANDRPEIIVSAASSLTRAFERYAESFEPARARLSFGGSDELAAQIRRGAAPDVYAAANTELPERLYRQGLVERPVAFATNELVLAVPAGSSLGSLEDLERPGMRLVVGAPTVPVGAYTREALTRLGPERARRILANVRSEEPDVKGVVAKLAQGAADAGFVYRTDAAAAGDRLRAIALAARLEPEVTYAAAPVRRSQRRQLARAFVEGLVAGSGADELRAAGFGAPPRP
jgi:molybdate transport system substrate-binding protein